MRQSPPIGYNVMKLQFSLATLLVCMTVLAVVAAISTAIPVHQICTLMPPTNGAWGLPENSIGSRLSPR